MKQINNLINLEKNYITSFENLVNIENNYGCLDGKIIGTGRADYTQESTVYDLSIDGKTFSLIDIPGIEGDERRFEDIIKSSLDKSHTIFYVNGSGKKIEKATLEKIKNYMHDGTSVYAIFNVHCKPKKERIPDIDKTYSEELADVYKQSREITQQTESELKSFLGDNYKGSISVNGLLAFCGLAFNPNGSTSIVYDKDKSLRSDQKKYVKEYNGNCAAMLEDSHFSEIQKIIFDKVDGFDDYIYSENIKKLKNRLFEMIEKISKLKEEETRKINGFIGIYDDFKSNCYSAKEDYIQSLRHIGHHAASDAFSDVKKDLFNMIEQDRGKTKPQKIQQCFDERKNEIINNIQVSLNGRMVQLQKNYEENIEDAVKRMIKDFDRERTKFKISLSTVSVSIDDSFADAFKYSLKSFGGDALRVISLAASGFLVGNVLGAFVGAVLGILGSVWNFFASEATRINRAKEKLQDAIDDQIDLVDNEVRRQIRNLNFENKINESYEQIRSQADRQKKMLNNVNEIINKVESELKRNYKKIS